MHLILLSSTCKRCLKTETPEGAIPFVVNGSRWLGLGDAVKAFTRLFGVEPCEKCRCRRVKLNTLFPSRYAKGLPPYVRAVLAEAQEQGLSYPLSAVVWKTGAGPLAWSVKNVRTI